MFASLRDHLANQLNAIRAEGLWKDERVLSSAQGPRITVRGRSVLNLCANNYLGLANHPDVVAAARAALDQWGTGSRRSGSSAAPRKSTKCWSGN